MFRRRFPYWLGLFCLVALVWFWLRIRENATDRNANGSGASSPTGVSGQVAPGRRAAAGRVRGSVARTSIAAPNGSPAGVASTRQPSYRLSNTDRSLNELGRSDTAILLENALI